MALGFMVNTTFNGIDNVSQPLKHMSTEGVKSVNKLMARFNQFRDRVNKFSKTDLGSKMNIAGAVGGIGGIAAALKESVTLGMEYEQTLTGAAAKMKETSDSSTTGFSNTSAAYKKLSDTAREFAASSKFTATDTANALGYMATAGFDAATAMQALPGVLQLATASGDDLARTSDIVTDELGIFGVGADKLGHINDAMITASTSTNTTVGAMFEALKKSGVTAKMAGYTMEQTIAPIEALANAGLKGEAAGTSLRSVMASLIKPTKESQALMDKYKISLFDATGHMKPMNQIIDIMHDKLGKLNSQQRLAAFNTMVGTEGMTALGNLYEIGGKAIEKYTKGLENSNGALDRMTKLMSNTVDYQFNSMNSSLQELGLTMYDVFKGPLTTLFHGIGMIVDGISGFIKHNEWAAGILKYLAIGLGIGGTALGVFTVAFAALNLVMSLNPIGAIIVSVGLLSAGIMALVNNWESISNWFNEFIESAKILGHNIAASLLHPVKSLLELLAKLPGVGDTFAGWADKIDAEIDTQRADAMWGEYQQKGREMSANNTAIENEKAGTGVYKAGFYSPQTFHAATVNTREENLTETTVKHNIFIKDETKNSKVEVQTSDPGYGNIKVSRTM